MHTSPQGLVRKGAAVIPVLRGSRVLWLSDLRPGQEQCVSSSPGEPSWSSGPGRCAASPAWCSLPSPVASGTLQIACGIRRESRSAEHCIMFRHGQCLWSKRLPPGPCRLTGFGVPGVSGLGPGGSPRQPPGAEAAAGAGAALGSHHSPTFAMLAAWHRCRRTHADVLGCCSLPALCTAGLIAQGWSS